MPGKKKKSVQVCEDTDDIPTVKLAGGVTYQEIKEGTGPEASDGKSVSRYKRKEGFHISYMILKKKKDFCIVHWQT